MKNKTLTARLCGDFDNKMVEAIQLLCGVGFKVSCTPVSGIPVELNYKQNTYIGLKAIKDFISNYN